MNTAQESWTGVGPLSRLHAELERQRETKLDTVIHTSMIDVQERYHVTPDKALCVTGKRGTQGTEFFTYTTADAAGITEHALRQLGQKQSPPIPTKYLSELASVRPQDAATLLQTEMRANPRNLFMRQLDGKVRAVMSDKYRVLDNWDLMFEALRMTEEVNARVLSCSISEHHMRIKLIAPELAVALDSAGGRSGMFTLGELGDEEWQRQHGLHGVLGGFDIKPDSFMPICEITNSETGMGGASVSIGGCSSACFNLQVFGKMSRAVHLGRKLDVGFYSEETVAADSKAIMLKMRDSIRGCFQEDVFGKYVAMHMQANADRITAPTLAVDNVIKAYDLPQDDKDALLDRYMCDYAPTRGGMSQAVSRMAQDNVSRPDVAALYERASGSLIEDSSVLAGTYA